MASIEQKDGTREPGPPVLLILRPDREPQRRCRFGVRSLVGARCGATIRMRIAFAVDTVLRVQF